MSAPFGRRLCEVAAGRDSGGYRVVALIDREGPEPEPGQFYMLAAAAGWGARDGRAFLPRAISVAETMPVAGGGVRLDFLLDAIGPGTERLGALGAGEEVWVTGPLGNSFASPREVSPGAAGAVLVGGGVGVAPLALLRTRFTERGVPHRVLLGFRDRAHAGGLDLFCGSSGALCPEVRLATEDGHAGHQGRVTDLLLPILAGDDAASAVVYTCGPPAMLEAVRTLCESHDVPCQIADESPMACGFGACFGCAVPKSGGGFMRLCVDGPVLSAGGAVGGPVAEEALATGGNGGSPAVTGPADRSTTVNPVNFCGLELEHPVINASGTYDALAARAVFGDALLDDFPFSAFVSKTITPEPRAGNVPRRIWETPSGMINSIGLPNKGLDGFLAEDLPRLAELPVPLIVSIMATTREDFGRCVERVAARHEVAAIELNISCPNVHSGLIVGENPSETEALLQHLRPLTEKPLIVKLTPNVADAAAVAAGGERGGADAVSLINTLKGTAVDPATGAPALGNGYGGLSGPAVRPVALEQVRSVRAAVGLRIVGMGGISSGADAAEFLALGADVVGVGTENFRDPRAGTRVAAELALRGSAGAPAVPALDLD
jgi:dihydroorotate dehydrogenase (NAD+) catalytic subunit